MMSKAEQENMRKRLEDINRLSCGACKWNKIRCNTPVDISQHCYMFMLPPQEKTCYKFEAFTTEK